MRPGRGAAQEAKAKLLIEVAEAAGYEARSYSGRFMYGSTCVGVTLERDQSVVNFVLDVIEAASSFDEEDDMENLTQALRNPRSDSMGLGTIIYWPELPWVDGDKKEEEEQEAEDET
jgi:hypothetical protein